MRLNFQIICKVIQIILCLEKKRRFFYIYKENDPLPPPWPNCIKSSLSLFFLLEYKKKNSFHLFATSIFTSSLVNIYNSHHPIEHNYAEKWKKKNYLMIYSTFWFQFSCLERTFFFLINFSSISEKSMEKCSGLDIFFFKFLLSRMFLFSLSLILFLSSFLSRVTLWYLIFAFLS